MNREDIKDLVVNLNNKHILLELSTGVGKSKLAIDVLKDRKANNILIVIPKLVLINNWKVELDKWDYNPNVTFSTYISLHKHINNHYDAIILDEAHHTTSRALESILKINYDSMVLLSATIKQSLKEELKFYFKDLYVVKVAIKEAIDNNILPSPNVYLLPLKLDNIKYDYSYIEHTKGTKKVVCNYKDRWKYLRDNDIQITVKCTQKLLIYELNSKIEYWKNMYYKTKKEFYKNKWLLLANQRLKYLSDFKTEIVLDMLKELKNYRTLTFCNSIEQTQLLGKNCINSKNKKSLEILEKFNNKKIKHITSVNMLAEGVNLSDCRIGIWASLNSSETLVAQKNGRLLRHKNPIMIIPYYKDTRDEEIVTAMIKDYNPELIKEIKNIKEIEL